MSQPIQNVAAKRFTDAMKPLLIEYRDRLESLRKEHKKFALPIYSLCEHHWRRFASSVSQHIDHAAIDDEDKVELTVRLFEFEAAIIALQHHVGLGR